MCQRHGSDQTPTLLFESKNHASINSYSITYAVKTKSGMNFKGQGHSPLKAIGQTPTLLFESKNNVSINSYSITYAVKTKSGMNFKGQGHSPLKAIGILTMVFYSYGPNLVILASTSDESSHGQIW